MRWRAALAFVHDLTAVTLAWYVAYWLRFNFDVPAEYSLVANQMVLATVPLYALMFLALGLYRGLWRYASVRDFRRILLVIGSSAVVVAVTITLFGNFGVPRSVLLLQPLLLILLMGGSRLAYRAWKDGHLTANFPKTGRPVLVLGAGDAASMLLRELASSSQWRVVGLLDDDPKKRGLQIHGITVLGPLADLAMQSRELTTKHAIIAMPSASLAQRRRASELAAKCGLAVLTVPAYDDLLSGKASISRIRRVELEDLLGREKVELDEAGLQNLLGGKTVLITGAGGSIGAELCRQIAHFAPARLILCEQSELALYQIEQEFALTWPALPMLGLIGDVKDAVWFDAVLRQHHPAVLFHAAAYKHVPMNEHDNAWATVRNNVLGTLTVAKAARTHGIGEFVFISTDKAVNPTNVMGASKRLAEMVCQALQGQNGTGTAATRFVMVRFGNVLGSSGSVIPRFREQIARGGPVTVTHPEIVRYFMLIPEAAQLVLQAGLMARRQDAGGQIFVLDMGEPTKIVDLARDLIRLSGFTEDEIRIEFTGLRPGEKLYEELLASDETTLPTPHPKVRVAHTQATPDDAWLEDLEAWLRQPVSDEATVKQTLARLVPEYRPQ